MLQQMVLFTFLVPLSAIDGLPADHPCLAPVPGCTSLQALVIGVCFFRSLHTGLASAISLIND